jgi:hypothetical protein
MQLMTTPTDTKDKAKIRKRLQKQVSLFPEENILTKEIESWTGFADTLKSEEDRKLFLKMLNDRQKYTLEINAKESLIMALLLTKDKMISWLSKQVSFQKMRPVNPKVEPQKGFNDSSFVMLLI